MALVDAATAVYAAQAIGAALYQRDRTRRGKRLEVTLMGCSAHLQTVPLIDDQPHAGKPRPPVTVPSGTFQTADGLLNVTALRDRMFFGFLPILLVLCTGELPTDARVRRDGRLQAAKQKARMSLEGAQRQYVPTDSGR
ncbi:MAG TPA: CoA transferase [Pseudorhodoferax sp.]|nr:CoA transferase [Pseudorhodoferax sp.]